MAAASLLLVLSSSLLHAAWNLLLKRSGNKSAFAVAFLWVSAVLYLPPAVWGLIHAGPVPGMVWVLGVVSAGIEAAYWYLLSQAYRRGDMSQVYPLARGAGALAAAVLGIGILGEAVSAGALAGIALILIGGYILHLRTLSFSAMADPWRQAGTPAFRLAVLAGLATGFYSAVDKVAMARYGAPVLPYLWMTYAGPALVLTLTMTRADRGALAGEWQHRKRSALAVGLLSPLTYLLVFLAMAISPVSRVAAVREITLVWGTLLGLTLLKEQYGGPRLVGAAAIAAGVILLAVSR